MSTRTLVDIKLEVTEPEQLSEDLIFTLSTDGASEQVDSDVALTYASQIDAMLGDSHTVEVAIATSLFERQQAVVAAAQADAAALAERLSSLGAKPRGAGKSTSTRRPRAATKAETEGAAPAPATEPEPAPAPATEPEPAQEPTSAPEAAPDAVTDEIASADPASATDEIEPDAPSSAQEFDDEPPADEPPAEDDAHESAPVTDEHAQFYVPAPGADGEEDVTEF